MLPSPVESRHGSVHVYPGASDTEIEEYVDHSDRLHEELLPVSVYAKRGTKRDRQADKPTRPAALRWTDQTHSGEGTRAWRETRHDRRETASSASLIHADAMIRETPRDGTLSGGEGAAT